MSHIDSVLTANTANQHFSTPIRAALSMGQRTLTRYHLKTDLSDVYRIAMGQYFFFWLPLRSSDISQFSILATNSSTSKTLAGLRSSVGQHISLYGTHSRCAIRTPTHPVRSRYHQTRCAILFSFRRLSTRPSLITAANKSVFKERV